MLGVVPRWWRNRKRDHFLPRKFIKRSSASGATPTEQRLITGIGSQMHRKAEQSPQRIKMKRETKDFGYRNTLLGRESWRRRSFYTMGNLTGEVSGDLRNLKRKHNWDNSPQKSRGMAITSWEAAYMSKPTWSKWGLDVEVWAASSVLRERTGVECREDTLRELMWLSIDRWGKPWTWQRNKGAFPWKGPNTTLWLLACSQNKGPCTSEYWRGMIQLPFMAPESERQVCDTRRQKARSRCNLSPRDSIWRQAVSGLPVTTHVFLVSWMAQIFQKCHSLRSDPLRRHKAHLQLCPVEHSGDWAAWTWKVGRCTAPLAPPLTWLWQLPCGPATASAPHTCQRHLQCSYLSTAQVSRWARVRGCFYSLVSGQRSDTEERLAARGGQHEQR